MKEITAYLLAYNNLLEDDVYQFVGAELAAKNPNAYLVAVTLDQGMKAEKVWSMPEQLGWYWNIAFLDSLSIPEISDDLRRVGCRYWNNMAKYIRKNITLLKEKYDGDASNIFNTSDSRVVYERLLEFAGIGQKKASMAINILCREAGLNLDRSGIDISYDKHIRQVFLRSGLAQKDDMMHIINVARTECPDYPGILDKPTWFIGKEICFNKNPDCEHCPLFNVCAKKIDIIIEGTG